MEDFDWYMHFFVPFRDREQQNGPLGVQQEASLGAGNDQATGTGDREAETMRDKTEDKQGEEEKRQLAAAKTMRDKAKEEKKDKRELDNARNKFRVVAETLPPKFYLEMLREISSFFGYQLKNTCTGPMHFETFLALSKELQKRSAKTVAERLQFFLKINEQMCKIPQALLDKNEKLEKELQLDGKKRVANAAPKRPYEEHHSMQQSADTKTKHSRLRAPSPSPNRMVRDNAAKKRIDEKGNFTYTADTSGYRPEELSVSMEGNDIVIQGEHKEEVNDETVHRQFVRRVRIPEGFQKEGLKCELDDGCRMHVTAPKVGTEPTPERRSIPIDVKAKAIEDKK